MQINISSIILTSLLETIQNIMPLLWPLLIIILIVLIYNIYKLYRLKRAGIFEIDRMTGTEFEKRLSILFKNLGYKVEETGKSTGDYGVDLVIEKDGKKTAVQAKCYKNNIVGEDAVREVYSGKNYYKCDDAMVITNSNYSRWARRLAESNNVKLWSRNYLVKVLLTEKAMKHKVS